MTKLEEAVSCQYQENFLSLVTQENGEIKVNWKGIDKLMERARESSYNEDLYNETLNGLIKLGVLSNSPNQNYFLKDATFLNLNPRRFSHLYFTNIDQAVRYRDELFENSKAIRIYQLLQVG